MIPKIIHYCWFGYKSLPPLAIKCIESWRKYFPDYEIREWNETNYNVHSVPYIHEAYEAKKYAFVSDYARFEILYKYGGIYFDVDVEVIQSMNNIIERGSFMGCENDADDQKMTMITVAPGLGIGVVSGLELYHEILELYATLHFVNPNGSLNLKTVVDYTTEQLCKHGLKSTNEIQECAGIWIYPQEYFCPISVHDGKLRITSNTVSIHHYAQSWQSPVRKYGRKIALFLGGGRLKELLKKIIYKS